MVLWIAIAGETCGVVASLILARWRTGVLLRPLWPVFATLILTMIAAALHALGPTLPAAPPRFATGLACIGCGLVCIAVMRDLQNYARDRVLVTFVE
jgi:uncharacterized membrane protein YoaK (UPF0700 family)